MQIDFHHAVTYILARWAGFSHEEADVVAYAAQYVDDSTYYGSIEFDNGPCYLRTASAHDVIDFRNGSNSQDVRTWVPFHFLPGNCGRAAGEECPQSYQERLVCIADSPIARDMLEECLRQRGKPNELHRLGITMHVYADTWAHQNFAGIDNKVNDVDDLTPLEPQGILSKLSCLTTILPTKLGHAQAGCCPDYPFLKWEYKNYQDISTPANNPERFMDASRAILGFMGKWRNTGKASELSGDQEIYLKEKFKDMATSDKNERHDILIQDIRRGNVPGIKAIAVAYAHRGFNSWKHEALGTDDEGQICSGNIVFNPAFMTSNWKLFHDALQFHRLFILNDLLPRYGICAA